MSTFKGDPDYNSLTPQTTKGDLAVWGSGGATRLAVGTDGLFIKADSTASTGLSYASPAGSAFSVATLTGATTLTGSNDIVLVSGTTFAVTLPNIYTNVGKVLKIKKTDSGLVTPISIIGITGTQTIDGNAGITLSTQYESVDLAAGASFWSVLSHTYPATRNTFGLSIMAVTTAPAPGTSQSLNLATWTRMGNCARISFDLRCINIGSNGSGTYLWPIPQPLVIDMNYVINASLVGASTSNQPTVGSGRIGGNPQADTPVHMSVWSATLLVMAQCDVITTNQIGSAGSYYGGGNNTTTFTAIVPIQGWW